MSSGGVFATGRSAGNCVVVRSPPFFNLLEGSADRLLESYLTGVSRCFLGDLYLWA